jgi:hypothetical protein
MDLSTTKGISPGTLIVLQRELETNPGFKPYLEEMLKDPDPAKRIFIEMQKSKMNVLDPKSFDKDVNTKKWQWSRRRIKPIVMNAESKGMSGLGDLGIFSMIASALVQQGAKELSKPSTQQSVMSYAGNKTSNKAEIRKRREDVMNEARKIGLKNSDENYKKAETVARGDKTFEEAFGLASKLSPKAIEKVSQDEIAYQTAQAAKLSEEGAEVLGVTKERKAGISSNTMLIGGGLLAAVVAVLAMRKK